MLLIRVFARSTSSSRKASHSTAGTPPPAPLQAGDHLVGRRLDDERDGEAGGGDEHAGGDDRSVGGQQFPGHAEDPDQRAHWPMLSRRADTAHRRVTPGRASLLDLDLRVQVRQLDVGLARRHLQRAAVGEGELEDLVDSALRPGAGDVLAAVGVVEGALVVDDLVDRLEVVARRLSRSCRSA